MDIAEESLDHEPIQDIINQDNSRHSQRFLQKYCELVIEQKGKWEWGRAAFGPKKPWIT